MTLPMLSVQTASVGASGGLSRAGKLDRAARIVHADHDRFSWLECGHDACRALRDAYDDDSTCDCG